MLLLHVANTAIYAPKLDSNQSEPTFNSEVHLIHHSSSRAGPQTQPHVYIHIYIYMCVCRIEPYLSCARSGRVLCTESSPLSYGVYDSRTGLGSRVWGAYESWVWDQG